MTDHPITPPTELVDQWVALWQDRETTIPYTMWFTQAARWGADQELEACCEWLVRDWTDIETADKLRAARRPKPPSLKEQALAALQEAAYMADDSPPQGICSDQIDTIRRALEALPE